MLQTPWTIRHHLTCLLSRGVKVYCSHKGNPITYHVSTAPGCLHAHVDVFLPCEGTEVSFTPIDRHSLKSLHDFCHSRLLCSCHVNANKCTMSCGCRADGIWWRLLILWYWLPGLTLLLTVLNFLLFSNLTCYCLLLSSDLKQKLKHIFGCYTTKGNIMNKGETVS